MQPVVSPVGHGSTHNTFGDDDDDLGVTETTPLVRFPRPSPPSPWHTRTTVAFGLLIGVLVIGSLIGIYLLYLQDRSDNVLPPVDTPLLVVPREKWSSQPANRQPALAKTLNIPSKHVVVVQTGTESCNDTLVCSELLKDLQARNGQPLPYNFFVSSHGVTFEGLGWDAPSPLFPSVAGVVVAVIGNFTKEEPSTSQVQQVFALLDASISSGRLARGFTVVGKASGTVPAYLFESLQSHPRWDRLLSDESAAVTDDFLRGEN